MKNLWVVVLLAFVLSASAARASTDRPNIVLVLMDNFGWGELGSYGGGLIRGAATPRIDSLADEGLRLLNFNVEAQCTPSRSALLTGRYAIRSGTSSVPLEGGLYGLTQWEVTLAEMLTEAGYDTAMFGKWHLGDSPGRYPTDQGFDEWYGIPNSSDESFWPDSDLFRPGVHPQVKFEPVLEARRGEVPREVAIYDSAKRRIIDREITDKAKAYLHRKANGDAPFFLFIPYTQTHMPVEPEPSRKGATGNGHWADVLAQTDAYVGELLDTVDELGLRDDTIFIFTSDNGPEALTPHQGFSGPWRGSYFTGLEGSLRVPFLMRWPGRVPAGMVSNEIVHETDLVPTLAKMAGAKIPTDRLLDGVDQGAFLRGQQPKSNREAVVIYVGEQVYGVKWRNWKMATREVDAGFGVPVENYQIPLFYNLHLDPKEERPMQSGEKSFWVRYPASAVLADHLRSLQAEKPIRPGTPDPYLPSN
ncbi:MAG: arylsulfatase [Myxococcota bacterium]